MSARLPMDATKLNEGPDWDGILAALTDVGKVVANLQAENERLTKCARDNFDKAMAALEENVRLREACQAALATHGLTDSEPGLPSLDAVEDMLRAALAQESN